MIEELLRLERALAERDASAVSGGLASLLGEGFFELGRSGRVWDRSSTVAALASVTVPRTVAITDFAVLDLAPDMVLATYRLEVGPKRSLRSSIWRRSDRGWRVVFHQGTPVE